MSKCLNCNKEIVKIKGKHTRSAYCSDICAKKMRKGVADFSSVQIKNNNI